MNSFIKNPLILEEGFKLDDLFDFSTVINDFKTNLEKMRTGSTIGLVGQFGSGKSTMLYQLYKDVKDSDQERWINFDAWKFPERKDLWEGFVLESAKCLDVKLFENARKRIDGTQNADLKALIRVVFRGINHFLPGASIGENFSSLLNSSPAKRVFELQEILHQLIEKTDKDIYIILEDIDRSGDRGIFFLETLRNFIKTNCFKRRIMAVVPIGTEAFQEAEDSYTKCLDYSIDFKTSSINFRKFVRSVFTDDFLKEPSSIERLEFLFQRILSTKEGVSIRKLKSIIRMADIEYQKIPDVEKDINPQAILLFTALRILKDTNFPNINHYTRIKDGHTGYAFLIWLANALKIADMQALESWVLARLDILFVNNPAYNVPTLTDRFIPAVGFEEDSSSVYLLSDKYLKYLHII